MPALLLLGAILTATGWFFGQPWWRRRRRLALAAQPFPARWQQWLYERTDLTQQLPPMLLRQLQGLIRIFVHEKRFVGCNGLTVTEEMRVVIAAYACLLLVNRPDVPRVHFYDELMSILVYPTAFVVRETQHLGHGVVREGPRILSGQAWNAQRILLSWEDIEEGMRTGHNVVLHEFAHYLDMEDESMDGAPRLGSRRAYQQWAGVFWAEYERLRADLEAGRPTFLNPYAASEPAEFFAVVTEAFYRQGRELERQHPGLYEQLRRYYRVDPARWPAFTEPA
ncbi:hypothetical protein ACG33_04215 [Steroidobacter denitrificans]|uniref:Zinc-dependent peptidase n=1 Tax=Steroidobacter denitrificans TaxID=465721 RepID=A0A127F7C5_STEDE|nr:hypothetical protein ACG33_04215 [Steroidobacter denitrificans]